MREEMETRAIHTLLGRAAALLALVALSLGAVLLTATSAEAYKPPNSQSCGKVKKKVTYKVYVRNLSCDKGRRIFKKTFQGRARKWSCELRQFPNGAPGIACRSGKKRIYGVSRR